MLVICYYIINSILCEISYPDDTCFVFFRFSNWHNWVPKIASREMNFFPYWSWKISYVHRCNRRSAKNRKSIVIYCNWPSVLLFAFASSRHDDLSNLADIYYSCVYYPWSSPEFCKSHFTIDQCTMNAIANEENALYWTQFVDFAHEFLRIDICWYISCN